MNDEDLEARLGRWRPAEPPPELMRRLRAAEPPTRPRRVWRPWFVKMQSPWPLAYAGLLAAWAFILALRLMTPTPDLESATPLAQTDLAASDAPEVAAYFREERALFFARNLPDQL